MTAIDRFNALPGIADNGGQIVAVQVHPSNPDIHLIIWKTGETYHYGQTDIEDNDDLFIWIEQTGMNATEAYELVKQLAMGEW